MKVVSKLIVVVGLVLMCGITAWADKPIQLAFWPPDLQLVNETESITGLRLNIYGRNLDMTGLDLGFIHESTGGFGGIALGLASTVKSEMYGLQWVFLYSRTGGGAHGWSSGLLSRVDGGLHGIQTSAVSLTDGDSVGAQLSFIFNESKADLSGLQFGLVNRAAGIQGVQIGIANFATNMQGLQIGIWNQIDSKPSWNVQPLVNWKF